MTDTAIKDRPATTVRALNCPNCGGTIALRAAGSTVNIICEHCGSTLDGTDPELRLIVRADQAMRRPQIALGTRGTLNGVAWEVVGYQERFDGEVEWKEYLLFNPYEGYAFLIDDRRRFSLGRLLSALPDMAGTDLVLDGERHKRFGDTYPVTVRFVVGEFYWRVKLEDSVDETIYVRPGTMLVCEENGQERTWSRAALLDWGAAERAFGLEPRAANYQGIPAPHEPSPYRTAMRDALMVAVLALAACLVIALGTAGSSRVLQRELQIRADGQPQTAVLGPITVTGARERVRVQGSAGLFNEWLDLDYSLVDRRTQRSYDASAVAEYYSGRDADGSWSEGDTSPDTGFAAIPRGTYDLVVEARANKWVDPNAPRPMSSDPLGMFTGFGSPPEPAPEPPEPVRLSVTVDRGGGFIGSFFLAILAILAWPVIAWGRNASFEQRRLSPLTGGTDDEEEDE